MKRTLIICNMSYQSDWDAGMVNRNYHVLQGLLHADEFDQVLSIDFLPFTFKKKLKVLWKQRLFKRNKNTLGRSLSCRVDKDEKRGDLYHMTALNLKSLPKIMRKLNIEEERTTIWLYNPFAAHLFEEYPNAVKVFDAVDNWIEHSSYQDRTEELQGYYNSIKHNADIIYTVSEAMVDFFDKKENVYYIPNGVDISHFAGKECGVERIKKLKGPIIGYHGVIQTRINFSILNYLAEKHEEFQFVLAGPVWKEVADDVKKLQKHKNVHVLGMTPYEKLPELISCFDVAIIPHKVDTFTQTMNPLKMYEYLAAGKPIISTPVAGADQFHDLILLAVSPEDFSAHIAEIIEEDSVEMMERRMTAVEQHDWSGRIEVMLNILNKK